MDPVTHGLIGASVAMEQADQEVIRPAAFVGMVSAMLPDLDVLINSASDPLLQLEYHRQFSHALAFIPIGAAIATLLLWWMVRRHLSLGQTYLFSLLGIGTAGLVDVMTSYGVQWFWPFTDERIAWNVISVFDPLCSLGVLLLTGWAVYRKKSLFAYLALGWATLFMSFGWMQQQRALSIAHQITESRGHNAEQWMIKPTIANQVVWSVRYVHNDTLYADAVRLMPFMAPQIYPGTSTPLLHWEETYLTYQGTPMYSDIKRFARLSDSILVRHPEQLQVIGDGRYAMLPTSTSPLWGIQIDTLQPQDHVRFETYRDASSEIRQQYLNMLLGR